MMGNFLYTIYRHSHFVVPRPKCNTTAILIWQDYILYTFA